MTIKQALREVVLSKMTTEDKIATILNVVTEGITGEMIEEWADSHAGRIGTVESSSLKKTIYVYTVYSYQLPELANAINKELRGE